LASEKHSLRRRAILLVWIGEIWNVFEAGIALWSAWVASSVALFAFGLDSLIELFAGGVLIWRFSNKRKEDNSNEKKALRLVGVTFFLLSAIILFQSIITLVGYFNRPQESLVGIFITVSSALVMTVLFIFKRRIAEKLHSRSFRAEAYESLFCDLQDLIVLVGLGLNALLGLWWADPVVALLIVPFLIREGLESFRDDDE
jgi:divalent metal cation (Fe/Co/Zn/Cd) transporter